MDKKQFVKLSYEEKKQYLESVMRSKEMDSFPLIQEDLSNQYEPFPLSDIQESYLVGKQIGGKENQAGCHIYYEFEVRDLDVLKLQEAWNKLVKRHPMLRAQITKRGKQQILEYSEDYQFSVYDMSKDDIAVASQKQLKLRESLSCKVYRAEDFPLYEIAVTIHPANVSIVHVSMDEWIVDASSIAMLFEQWYQLYDNLDYQLEEIHITYRDYILANRKFEFSSKFQSDLNYWKQEFASVDAKAFNFLNEKMNQNGSGIRTRYCKKFNKSTWEMLKSYAKRAQVSPTSCLLAAFLITLNGQMGQSTYPVILTVGDRMGNHPDLQKVIGPFITTLYLVEHAGKTSLMDEKVKKVQQKLWDIMDHRSVSGIRILRELKKCKYVDSNYSVPIVFTSMLSSVKEKSNKSWYHNVTYSITQTPQVCLDCQVMEEDGCLVIHWDVQEDCFSKGLISNLFYQFVEELEKMLKEPVLQIDAKDVVEEWDLTILQKSYWFLQYRTKEEYWEGLLYQEFEVEQENRERLESRWKEIVRNTSVLHSVFTNRGTQKESAQDGVSYSYLDIKELPEQEKEAKLEKVRRQILRQKFSLFEVPRCSMKIVQIQENKLRVCLAIDPSIADGPSLGILYQKLFGKEELDGIEKMPFSTYMTALKKPQDVTMSKRQEDYWKNRIHMLTNGPFQGRKAVKERQIKRKSLRIACLNQLVQYATKENVKLDAVLIGVYEAVLSRWDENDNFTIVNVSWDRKKTIPSIDETIGDFTETDWFIYNKNHYGLAQKIKIINEQLEESSKNRQVQALAIIAKEKKNVSLPVVYTNLVKWKEAQLPVNVHMGYGVSITPGVILDMIPYIEQDTLVVNLDYDESVFNEKEIEVYLEKYETYLTKLWEVEPLDTKVVNHMEWNKQCIHEYVELQQQKNPNRIAVKMKDNELTYRELNETANQLARYFIEKGVCPGDFIAICLDKSVEMIVIILAVLKAGATYIPIDPVYPKDRIAYTLNDCQPKLLITSSKVMEKLDDNEIPMITLDTLKSEIVGQPKENPVVAVSGENVAYIIYTSGSTGRPKGVMVTHWNVVRLFRETDSWYHFSEQDIWTMYHSFAFDFSVWEIWGALLFGGILLVVPYEISRSFQEFYLWLAKEKVTVLNQTPTAFNQLLKAEKEVGVRELALRYIIFGGEALHFKNLEAWYERHGEEKTQLVNMYGITETTVHVTYRPITRKDLETGKSLIGECIPDLKLYLLDDSLKQVKNDEIGEICVSGEGVAKGYLNRTELTNEKFVENPYGEGRLYLSGDLGRYTENGEIEYIGRKDKQVKVRGFRIELGEIESVLVSHPHIEQAAVQVDNSGKEIRLIAYLVTDKTTIKETEIRKFVRQKLPDYMVPNVIREIDEIGLTINGKLDYQKIISSDEKELADEKGNLELMGKNALEQEKLRNEIHQIIKEELESDTLDEKEDIFNLGGTSLTIVNVAKRVAEELDVEVPIDIFLEHPVIEEITEYILNFSCKMPVEENKTYQKISKDVFSRLLGLLKKETFHGKTRYLYASAGGKNAVQTYIYVKENGVEGVPEGVYYYHPEEHALYVVSAGKGISKQAYAQYYQEAYRKSSFALFFIAQLTAIEPVYLDFSQGLVTVDSGYIKQLLLMSPEAKEMGLIGADTIDFDSIKAEFDLDDTYICLSGMLGGNGYTEEDFSFPSDWTRKELTLHMSHVPSYLTKEKQEELIKNMKYNQLSKREILELTKKKLHIRRFKPGTAVVELAPVHYEERRFINRSSKREFEERQIHQDAFLELLSKLSSNQRGHYAYPSIGNQYLVKTYVYVKEGAVEGLEQGAYYYDQESRKLTEVNLSIKENIEYCYTPFNRPHYKQSSFCIFLVINAKEAEQIYGAPYLQYALCESGAMGQVITNSQADFGLGLVPIGGMNFEKLHESFGLTKDHMMIHSFMGGPYNYTKDIHPQAEEIVKADRNDTTSVAPAKPREIAIIGMSGKFPMADSVIEFWDNLLDGKNCITEVPEERWKEEGMPSYGGFLRNIDVFDPRYFNIAPDEARYLDPQARLFIMGVNEALYDAGYQFTQAKEQKNVGVFVGSMYQHYHLLDPGNENEDIMAIQSYSSIANRTSYYFNFTGPSIAVDTACSSAITAISMACESIKSGQTDTCVAGGVNLTLHPAKYSALRKMGLLSSQKETRCFGNEEGFICGEGVGVLVLKEREKAVRDHNHIYGLIKDIQISHTGRTKAYSMPSTSMERELIENTLRSASLTPDDIDYVECAANGTCLADAAEYNALKQVFAGSGKVQVPIGTVKSNIGHLEAASGIVQIIKVLLQFKHKQLVPTINIGELNSMISKKNSKLSIVTENADWKTSSPCKNVLIDTFAAGGTNACTILSEYIPQKKNQENSKQSVILLSANDKEGIKKQASELRVCLERQDIRIEDLEYTLSLFKHYLPARAVILCNSKEDLVAKLASLEQEKETEQIYLGFENVYSSMYRVFKEDKKGIQLVKEWIEEPNISSLSELWVHGVDIDWQNDRLLSQGNKITLRFPFYQNASLWIDKTVKERECTEEVPVDTESGKSHDCISTLYEIMNIDENSVSPETTLQSLGFNSIYAIKFLARMQEESYPAITIRELMKAETLMDVQKLFQNAIDMYL